MASSFQRQIDLRVGIRGLLLIGAAAIAAPAWAQGEKQTPPPTDSQMQGGIETVYVTAQKRIENQVDVPISITVNTAEDLENKNIGDLTELGQKMPNVNAGGTLFGSINIRGITSNSAGAGSGAGFPPDVGANVDEVFQGRDRAFDTVLSDISSVEVLRGPQGTLYGKNTVAGVINVTTERPTNDYEALGDVRIGNYGYYQLRGTVSGPIIEDDLLVRITGFKQSRDGYIYDPVLDKDLGSLNQWGGRIMIVSHPTNDFTFELRADLNGEADTNGQRETVSTINGSIANFPPFNTVPPQNPYDRIVDVNTMPVAKRNIWGTSAKAEYVLDDYVFTSITAWRHYNSDYDFDQDGGPLNAFDTGLQEGMDRFSQELRITSPADQRFSWIVGAYIDHEKDLGAYHIEVGDAFPTFLFPPPFPFLLPTGYLEASSTHSKIDGGSQAGFASAKFNITDNLNVSGGLRFTHEHKDLDYSQLPTLLDPSLAPLHVIYSFALPIPPLTDSYDDSAVTGDASISYTFAPNQVGYFRFSHGFKAGGFQADVISPPFDLTKGLAFKPETLNDYEIGFKSILFDDTVSANVSAFYYDFTNKQEQVNTGVSFVVSNAASATIKGVELELNWAPMEGLKLFANGGYLDAYYDKFPNGGGVGIDFDGNQLAGASKFSASWGGTYTAPLTLVPGTNYVLTTDWDYRDPAFTDPANTVAIRVEPYLIINGRIGVEDENGHWGVYMWGRNLSDRTVLSGGVDVIGGLYVSRGINIGRTFGVELRGHT
ncbi:MAG TPA: TonB-dependent receptor [Rhizomicrobium sp.]|nr:TonB-dependent receptor [Rhizomicrobium sp.]